MGGRAWLFLVIALLLLAGALRQPTLLLVGLLLLLASGSARLWADFSLRRLEYERRLSAVRVFFGETVTLEVAVANRKLLPLASIHVRDELPAELTLLRGRTRPGAGPSRVVLSNLFSLGWYQRVVRRYPIQCDHRGYFPFGPAVVRSGDPFGLFSREQTSEEVAHLVVYPRIVPLEQLGIPSKAPFGALRVQRHLHEDPVQVAALREYVPGDALKRVYWKGSARSGRLQSRVFERTTTVDLALFVDARTVEPPLQGYVEQLLETVLMVAGSIASHAREQGFRVGLYVNESYRDGGGLVRLPPSDHPEQLQRILEALAHLQGWALAPLERVMEDEARRLAWAATIVVVTAAPHGPLTASLGALRRAGRRVAAVLVGSAGASLSLEGIRVYRVSGELDPKELTSLSLGQPEQGA